MVGGALSFYFYSVYQGKMFYKQWWMPPVLRMTSDNCSNVIDTPYGRHFNLPNAALGAPLMVLYAALLFLVGNEMISKTVPLSFGVITLFVAVYLIYGLWKINKHCRICYTVHFLNLVIFIMQLI